MKKSILSFCALMCTNVFTYAQKVGDVVTDEYGISYKISKVTESATQEVVSVNNFITYESKGGTAPYINYNHTENISFAYNSKALGSVVSYSGTSNSKLTVDVATGMLKNNYSVSYENAEEWAMYSACSEKFLSENRDKKFDVSSGTLRGTATFMSYAELRDNKTYKKKSIYIDGTAVTDGKFDSNIKGKENQICMLVLEGVFNITSFPVKTFNVTESIAECTPTSVSSGIDWKGSKVNVAECVESVAEGAFATASYAIRAIDDNDNCYEPIFAYSSKHGSPRYGLYVGKNFNGDLTSEIKAGLCFVDFSSDSNVDLDKFSTVNANCLYYFPGTSKMSGDNVVVGNVCDNLVLSRESACPFYNIKPFTANNMTMNNVTLSNSKFVAYCLPFGGISGITVDNTTSSVNEILSIAEFKGYENSTLSYSFSENGFRPNVPCIIKSKLGNYTSFGAKNVEVLATEPDVKLSTDNLGGWRMVGSYQAVEMDNEDYDYFGLSNNSIAKATLHSTTLKPFSSIMVKMEKNADVNGVRLRVDENVVNSIDVADATDLSVDLSNGITLKGSSYAKISSISGSVIFNGMVDGTKSFNVPDGVYVVNGKKVIVK